MPSCSARPASSRTRCASSSRPRQPRWSSHCGTSTTSTAERRRTSSVGAAWRRRTWTLGESPSQRTLRRHESAAHARGHDVLDLHLTGTRGTLMLSKWDDYPIHQTAVPAVELVSNDLGRYE